MRAAAFANVDEVRLVGLVDTDWPEPATGNIFYPAALLRDLGWPPQSDRLAAARARFQDLLELAGRRVSVSTFTLEDSVSNISAGAGCTQLASKKVRCSSMPNGPIALLRLDTDWYESTRHELEHLYPRLVRGGVLVIDDYGHWAGARKAVDDYIAEHKLCLLLNRVDYTARIAVKP